MILISGTSLSIEQLPNYDLVDYKIQNTPALMGIDLKTSARQPTCFQVYISEACRTEYTITEEIESKLIYFTDDDHLLKLLEGGGTVIPPEDPFEEMIKEEEVVVPEFEPPKPIVNLNKKEEVKTENNDEVEEKDSDESVADDDLFSLPDLKSVSVIPELDLEMANTELPESVRMIPNIDDDIDSWKMLIKTKDDIIAQKDGIIKDLKNRIEDAYKLQALQLEEVENLYKEKMAECQNLISELEKKGQGVNLDEETSAFLKYINYAKSNKAIVKEIFTEEESKQIGVLRSKYTIFATGSGDSSYSLLKQMRKYLEKGHDCVILDFSNDNFLASIFKLNSKTKNTMGLLKDDVNPISLLTDINGTKFMSTTSYNDIALLNIDWPKLLRKIDDMASGKDVIMVFGAINNFNVRYTVSKLATIGKLFIFAKCSPIILSSLYSDVQFIPKNRVRIVALEYIDVVKSILAELAKYFEVLAFAGDIEWNKLDLKK